MEISEYEKQRLANMAANKRILDALGLSGDNSLSSKEQCAPKAKRVKTKPDDDDDVKEPTRVQPKRGDGATSYKNFFSEQYSALDELDRLEEQHRRQKNARATKKPITYMDEQADQLANEKPRRKSTVVTHSDLGIVDSNGNNGVTNDELFMPNKTLSFHPGAEPSELQRSKRTWTVQGKRGVCPICKGIFKINKANAYGQEIMRKHTPCIPIGFSS